MNKVLLILLAFFLQFSFKAQNLIYTQIKQVIQEKHPEKEISQKLLGIVIWSSKNPESIELIESFNKSIHIYNNAKLKGGLNGVEVLAVNIENLTEESIHMLERAGISTLIQAKANELKDLELSDGQNILFDSSGNEVYRNLNASEVFSSINKLITR